MRFVLCLVVLLVVVSACDSGGPQGAAAVKPPAAAVDKAPPSASPPLSLSVTPPATPMTPNPANANVAQPLAREGLVWDAVVRGTAGTVAPVLRPADLPAGLATIQIKTAAEGAYVVEYRGPDKLITVAAGAFNPPPVPAGGEQRSVSVRGGRATLQVASTARADERVWLWWEEPGRWAPAPGDSSHAKVFYLVIAEGVPPDDVLRLAASLSKRE